MTRHIERHDVSFAREKYILTHEGLLLLSGSGFFSNLFPYPTCFQSLPIDAHQSVGRVINLH